VVEMILRIDDIIEAAPTIVVRTQKYKVVGRVVLRVGYLKGRVNETYIE
jgi:hypothetical protein